MKKLYLIHCGFYDENLSHGVYESHVNLFVVADHFEEARTQVKLIPEFKIRKMHVDGLQEIEMVQGYSIEAKKVDENQASIIRSHKHRDLAPKGKT
jgi:hypothetical protein